MNNSNKQYTANIFKWITIFGLFLFLLLVAGMYGCPAYNVYSQGKAGEAKLKEAESSRQIAIQEAHAKKESAKDLAEAEVIRARGVAQANEIIGQSLKNNDSYLRYLWIQNLESNQNDVIYVPTEAGLPILEAQRLMNKKQEQQLLVGEK
jgi:regulator of protease activity HflC (stomatin/prohibitin superfamily)